MGSERWEGLYPQSSTGHQNTVWSKVERKGTRKEAIAKIQGKDYGQLDKGGHSERVKSYRVSVYFKYGL